MKAIRNMMFRQTRIKRVERKKYGVTVEITPENKRKHYNCSRKMRGMSVEK